ncbi:MAG: calcium-binding protein, partial [Candidatus Obscuribacterales bacterium]
MTNTLTYVGNVDGIGVEYESPNNSESKAKDVMQGLRELEQAHPGILDALYDAGVDKIRIKSLDEPLKGLTPDCAHGEEPDVLIDEDRGTKTTLKHEMGHILDDMLGEQLGRNKFINTAEFAAALAADLANQAAHPELTDGVSTEDLNFYKNPAKSDDLFADLVRADADETIGNHDTANSYTNINSEKMTKLFPNLREAYKNALAAAIAANQNDNGPDEDGRGCNDYDWNKFNPFNFTFSGIIYNAVGTFGSDPLILDLDGDGLETSSLDKGLYFNLAGQFGTRMAWAGKGDGVLGIDLNANGVIDDGTELIGSQLTYSSNSDSFQALSTYDSNSDGIINASDTLFSSLLVRQIDGVTQSLSDLNIASINLTTTITGITDTSGNHQTSISSFTRNDTTTGAIGSYVLQMNPVDTINLAPVELSIEVENLPFATGAGSVVNLQQALELDSSGTLLSTLNSFMSETNLEVQDQLLDQLLFKWTGSENAPSALHMDGRIFAVIEKFAGADLVFPGSGNIPGYEHQLILEPGYRYIKDFTYGQIMFNGGPLNDISTILRADSSYDLATTDRIYNLDGIADYFLNLESTDSDSASLQMSQFLRSMRGLDLFKKSNYADFYDAISGGSLTLKGIIDNFGVNPSYTLNDTTIDRSSVTIDETVTTSGNNNWVVLGSGNVGFIATGDNTWLTTQTGSYDIAVGGGTNNIYLGSGAATISADGAGTTNIQGNIGDNQLNFGQDTGVMNFKAGNVNLQPHTDSVNFGTGFDFSSVILSAQGSDLIVQFGQSSSDQLILRGELAQSSAKQISTYSFANGTILTAEQFGEAGLTFEASGSSVTFDHSGSYVRETINLSGSNSTLRIGTVENTVNISGNSDFIYGGNSDNTYNIIGSGNTILAGSGDNTVNSAGFNNQIFLGSAVAGVSGIGDNTVLDTGVGNQFWFNPGSTQTGSANITVGTNAGINLGTGHVDVNVGLGTGTTVIRRTGPAYTPGDSDTVNFGAGVTQSSLYFWSPPVASGAVTQYDLNIDIASGEKVVLNAGLAGGAQRVETFTFADGSTLTLDQVLTQGVHVIAFTDPFFGGPSIDRRFATWKEIVTVIGDNGQLYEGSGNDAIEDRGNNNYINAGAGDNTIIAGNNSTIVSNFGTNAITIKAGSGTTHIQENGALGGAFNNGNDTLIFGAGITEDNILASFTSENILQIDLSTGEQVIIEGETLDPFGIRQVSTFTFAGGQSFTVQQLLDMSVMAINNSLDNVTIDRSASTVNERINNSGHFDTILFGAGTTTLNDTGSDNLVYVGTGKAIINASSNSSIFGGAGDATINIANGVSGVQVFEQTAGAGPNGYDSVVLSGAVSVDEYTLSSVGKDLTLTDSLGAAVLTLKDGLDATAVAKSVADFSFSNGSHVAFADLIQRGVNVSDSSSDATVDRSFSAAKEIISHTGSNGTFLLGTGDVTMTVGTNDIIHSGSGSSAFNIAEGSGSTTIIEDALSMNNGAGDSIQLLNPVDTNQVTVRASGSDFTLGFAPGDTVTLVNQLDGAGLKNIGAFINSDGSILVDSAEIQQIADASRSTAGDDVLTGSRFGDQINGGDGNDTISAGLGNDDLSGGLGDDILSGDSGNDFLYGDDGDDTLNGGSGEDILNGYVGADTLNGNDGNDVLVGGLGNDIASGGIGDDTYVFNLGDGVDTIDDGAGALGGGNDAIELGALRPNVLFAAEGEDLRISFTQSAESVLVQGFLSADSSRHIELVKFSDGSNISYADIVTLVSAPPGQDIFGTSGNDTLAGTIGADRIYGQNGHDTINAGAGDDLAYGGNGNDAMNGEDGNDILFGEAGVDTLHGGIGMDAIDGGAGNDFLYGDEGDDNLLGGTGLDELRGGDGNDALDGGAANDILYGDSGNDTLAGGTGIDYLYGGTGTDSLDGGSGADFLYGEDNNDTLVGGGGNDTLDGGAGDDNLDGGDGADFLYGMDGNDVLSGGTGVDTIDGGIGDDTISGGTGNDVLLGGDGIDHIDGGVGSDDIHGGAGDDILIGAGGNDTIAGDDGNDSIYGDTGNDILTGGTGNDYLEGKNGVDTLSGSTGDDSLVGGYGNDTYLFSQGDGVDTINDQGRVSDHMDTIRFGTGVTTQDIAFYMQGNDLYLSQGAGDSIKITDQASTTSKIEKFELADGHFAGSADINLLIQQMVAFDQDHTEVDIT